MDFGMLPPEVNSARIYAGPGAESLLSASRAWTELAAELHLAAESSWSTVSALTEGGWLGPSSAAMAIAVKPYVAWLTASATQAEQTASQAGAAASAYEDALSMTVPPALIAANRTALATLIATNVLGQNTPAIAAAEAAYEEMWALDAAAMYGYAAASAAATTVNPFASPPPTSGQADLSVAAALAASRSVTASTAESTAPQVLSAVPSTLQGLASPAVPSSATETLSLVTGLNLLTYPARFATYPMNFLSKALGFTKSAAGPVNAVAAGAATAARGSGASMGVTTGLGHAAPAISASMGQARIVGPMSLPHSWSGLPVPSTPGLAPLTGTPAVAGALQPGGSAGPSVMTLPARSGRNAMVPTPRYDLRPVVIPHSPAAG